MRNDVFSFRTSRLFLIHMWLCLQIVITLHKASPQSKVSSGLVCRCGTNIYLLQQSLMTWHPSWLLRGRYIYICRLSQNMTITHINHLFSVTLSSYWNINSRKFTKRNQSSMMGNMIKHSSKIQKYWTLTIGISTDLKNSRLVRF